MLKLTDIDAFRGQAQVLCNLNIEVKEGQVVALLGRNGSGKSSILRAIMGLLPISSGQVALLERSITNRAPQAIARRGIAYVPDNCRLFPDLTVMQNLRLARQGRRKGVPHWTFDQLCQLFPNLAELRKERAGALSGGEQKIVALARALMGNPRLLLLDEPAESLSAFAVQEMAETIGFLRDQGVTILLSDQNLRFAAAISNWAYLLDGGTVAVEGDMAHLAEHGKIWQEYLAA